nr:LOW QUALITY PROTEIN: rhomboid-related protein 2-like [Maniola hyperantus]
MAPDAEDCEQVERLNGDYQEVPVHQGRRILPEEPPPAQAWAENEESGLGNDSRTNSPGENRRLLGSKPLQKSSCRLQAGLTLGVLVVKKPKCTSIKSGIKTQTKTKFQKRKEKLKHVLRPPYFIITMLFLNVMVHLCAPEEWRAKLEWAPGAWWKEPWRLLTYGLVHMGTTHLALNALMALAVGWRLECEQGWLRVATIWLGGVAAGALGAGALQPQVRVVGASAAVYALLTAHLPNVCHRFGHIPLWWFRPLSVVVLGVSEGCWALLRAPGPKVSYNHVAWAAHALGAASGVPLAFLVFTGENSPKRSITVCRLSSILLLASGLCASVVHYVYWYKVDPWT